MKTPSRAKKRAPKADLGWTPVANAHVVPKGKPGAWTELEFASVDADSPKIFAKVMAKPAAKTLTRVTIGENGAHYDDPYDPLLALLPKTVRALTVGVDIVAARTLYGRLKMLQVPPHLETLVVACGLDDFASLPDSLHTLRLTRYTTPVKPLRALWKRATWPALEELELVTRDSEWADESLGAAIFAPKKLPKLRRLVLNQAGYWTVKTLVASKLIRQLDELHLRDGELTGEGAEILAKCPDLDRLKRLDVSGQKLAEWEVRSLSDRPFRLEAGGQRYSPTGE